MSSALAESADILDRTIDVDSHEMVPSHLWGEIFGEASGRIGLLLEDFLKQLGGNDFYNPDVTGDREPINTETVWHLKGTRAPGAFDFERRLSVMDMMGVRRQLVFPSYGMIAGMVLVGDEHARRVQLKLTIPDDAIDRLGRAGLDEYNEWAIRMTDLDPDRIRVVVCMYDDGTVVDLMEQARAFIARGARAINLPPGVPPGGVSPADAALDPFWSLLEENDVPAVIHIGNQGGFLKAQAWSKAPAFKSGKTQSHELGLEPYSMATLHMPACNFLTVMVLGGVFERFPQLRFGVIETGSNWLGPLAENLDMWAGVHRSRLQPFISMLPSEYLARNVRVTPFNNFEPIEQHFERYPHLQDCYCYSTDYPHVEGGIDIKNVFNERMSPLGPAIMEKFFVGNGQLLLPE